MLNSIILIGARGGSKRIPKKNLQLIGEHPLIYYSIDIGVNLNFPVYLSTDDHQIASIGKRLGVTIIYRPVELASDNATDYDWISHALESIGEKGNIIFLRPTTPFRNLELIKEAIDVFNEKKYDSLRSVEVIPEALEKHFRIEKDTLKSPFNNLKDSNLPNHRFPKAYKANGYVDILKRETINKNKDIYGNKIQAFITPHTIDIDTLEDLEYANWKVKEIK